MSKHGRRSTHIKTKEENHKKPNNERNMKYNDNERLNMKEHETMKHANKHINNMTASQRQAGTSEKMTSTQQHNNNERTSQNLII